jgi:hypothetical protein
MPANYSCDPMPDESNVDKTEFFDSKKRKKYRARYRKRIKYRKTPIG